jgi:hypothetical protein
VTAFATPGQLAATLGVPTPTDQAVLTQWNNALDDATGILRDAIGQPVSAGTAELSVDTDGRGVAELWLVPVTAITSVLDEAGNTVEPTDWTLRDQRLYLRRAHATYTVTVAYGYTTETMPAEIVRWTKVLAAAQLQAAPAGHLGLSAVTDVAIDDGKVTYTDTMAVALPAAVAQRLKAVYGGPQ